MKQFYTTFLILVTFIFGQVGFTQDKTIVLDFKNQTLDLTPLNNIQKGKLYKLKINNINTNLFNVSINKKDSIIPSNVNFPTLDIIGIDIFEKVAGSIVKSVVSSSGEKINKLQEEKAENQFLKAQIEIELNGLRQKLYTTNQFYIDFNKNKKIFSPEKFKRDSIEYDENRMILEEKILYSNTMIIYLDSLLNDLNKKEANLKTLISKEEPRVQVLDNIVLSGKKIETELETSKPFIEEINKLINSLNLRALSYLESLYNKPDESIIDDSENISFKEINQQFNNIRKKIEKNKKVIEKIEKEYDDFKKKHEQLFEKDGEIKKQNSQLEKNISEVKTLFDTTLSKISNSKITEYFTSIIHLDNNSERSYTSLPLQHNGDINKLTINITPKKPEYGQSYTAEYIYPENKVYVGIGGSFYYATSFKNDVYSVQETVGEDSSDFRIINEEEKKGEVGFATLLHVGSKFYSDWLGIHGTIGPALSLYSEPQFRVAFGGGISLGKNKNMVSIDFLGMAGNVERKSNVFSENEVYDTKPEQITISKLTTSFAFSIGYIYKF